MRPRKYYQFIEKEKTSTIWIVLHIICFIGIAVSSMVGANALSRIYDTFNYRCIAYAKVSIKLVDVSYKNETNTEKIKEDSGEQETRFGLIRAEDTSRISPIGKKLNLGIFEDDYNVEFASRSKKLVMAEAEPVPGVEDVFIYDEELWVNNDTLVARAHLGMTTTVFASLILCDYLIIIPFSSLIVVSTFTMMIILFRKSFKSFDSPTPGGWMYVYPLIIATCTMTILSVVAFLLTYNGLNDFCSQFSQFTGQKRCSPILDYLTKEQRLGRRHFYRNAQQSQLGYFIAALLWAIHTVIVLVRIGCTADFYLVKVLIRKKMQRDDQGLDDAFFDDKGFYFEPASRIKLIEVVKEKRKTSKKKKPDDYVFHPKVEKREKFLIDKGWGMNDHEYRSRRLVETA
ncbi:unnamed protein product [Phyllotreta striolata]|uniref:Uncharacterized protein n=1 Tax=Phyllotreta striolata TaxID=444603 RepID=A0A9N9TWJ2_PHYSR|nr:unnamed protein product [Phyllotreta striolata]